MRFVRTIASIALAAITLAACGEKGGGGGDKPKTPENTANLGNPWIETDKDGFVQKLGLDLLGVTESPLRGRDKGNIEYLAWWRKPLAQEADNVI